ncbi:MAG TPA: hypothetical protein VKT78_02535 [Fimbriimonadaceae bacterium]|nr:hypothetical protein [Fimbriimonadaceae bacterium]
MKRRVRPVKAPPDTGPSGEVISLWFVLIAEGVTFCFSPREGSAWPFVALVAATVATLWVISRLERRARM